MKKYRINEKISYRSYHEFNIHKTIIYNHKTQNYIFLDGLSSVIFRDVTNEYSLSKIIKKYKIFDIEENDIMSFLNELGLCGIFFTEGNNTIKSKGTINVETSDQMIQKEIITFCDCLERNNMLFSFHIDLTNQCNEFCVHCYHPFSEYEKERELSTKEIISLIDDLYDIGVFSLVISGGEALLYPGIWEVLEQTKEKRMKVTLYSNGLLIDEKIAERLDLYNVALVGISLYSHCPKIHDEVTGIKGSYYRTINAIKILKMAEINVEIKCVVLKQNFSDIDKLEKLAEKLQCKIIFDYTLTCKLNGEMEPYQYALEYNDYMQLAQEKKFSLGEEEILRDEFYFEQRPCNAGRYSLYMNPYGEIFPCVSFRLKLGRYERIKKFYEFQDLIKWKKIKRAEFSECGKHEYCKYCFELCAGVNLMENGNYLISNTSFCLKAKVLHDYYINLDSNRKGMKEEEWNEKTEN